MKTIGEAGFINLVIRDWCASERRFTANKLVTYVLKELGYGRPISRELTWNGIPYLIKQQSDYSRVHKMVNSALNRPRNKLGQRLYIHSVTPHAGPIWFALRQSTPEEEIKFGYWLREQGNELVKEGDALIREGKKRQRYLSRTIKVAA